MKILISNPRASYQRYASEIDAAIFKVLQSGWYILGEACNTFENDFATFCQASHAIGVANGTDAIELSLRGLGVKGDDKVITVANTAVATVSAIERLGAIPLFVDVNSQSQTLCPVALENCLRNEGADAAAVVVVHLFGMPCDMTEIMAVAERHSIAVVEDCAQAHGATVNGKHVGTIGNAGTFSFYPTKNLGAIGDGGAIITDSKECAERIRFVRQYGWRKRYISEFKGLNSRLDELQAAILSVKLQGLNEEIKRRRNIADQFNRSFAKLPLGLPYDPSSATHAYHQYVLQCEQRDALMDHLAQKGIGTAILYPMPIHRQPAYSEKHSNTALPVTEGLARRILSLPVYPELRDEEVEFIIGAVLDFYNS